MDYRQWTINYGLTFMNNNLTTQFLEQVKTDLINSLQANGKFATGQTDQQITITNDGNTAQLQIPGYLQIVESGRGPTPKDAVKSDPPMIQRIMQWCQAKGIPAKAAWAVKKSIDKKGYKGTPGLITSPLSTENLNLKLTPILDGIATQMATQITDRFK